MSKSKLKRILYYAYPVQLLKVALFLLMLFWAMWGNTNYYLAAPCAMLIIPSLLVLLRMGGKILRVGYTLLICFLLSLLAIIIAYAGSQAAASLVEYLYIYFGLLAFYYAVLSIRFLKRVYLFKRKYNLA